MSDPTGFHSVGNTPSDDIPAVNIHNNTQVHITAMHRNVTDVDSPNLIDTIDCQVSEQVGAPGVMTVVLGRQ